MLNFPFLIADLLNFTFLAGVWLRRLEVFLLLVERLRPLLFGVRLRDREGWLPGLCVSLLLLRWRLLVAVSLCCPFFAVVVCCSRSRWAYAFS